MGVGTRKLLLHVVRGAPCGFAGNGVPIAQFVFGVGVAQPESFEWSALDDIHKQSADDEGDEATESC